MWTKGVIFPHDVLAADGYAVPSQTWIAANGGLPAWILLRRADGTGKTKVLHTQTRDGTDTDIAVTTKVYQDLATGDVSEQEGIAVELRAAGFWRRAWTRPRSRLDLAVAVLGFVSAVLAALVALIAGLNRGVATGAPIWLIATACFAAAVLATVKLVQDVRKVDD